MTTPVQAATDRIHAKLETGWFNPVTHDEVNDIAKTLKGLSAADATAVINNLSASGDLNKLAGEAVDGSWFGNGGFTASERKAFFADMAGKLDGATLSKLSNAFIGTDAKGLDGVERGNELASAIATHASTTTKIDFVREQAKLATDQTSVSSAGIVSTIKEVDPQASAIATVIGSMKGQAAADAFAALSPKEQRAVMTASIEADFTTTASGYGASMVGSWDVKKFDALMTAAASVPSADLKARLFDAGVDTMRSVRETNGVIGGLTLVGKDKALSSMTNGLTRVLNSDVSGVVSELNLNRETRDGSDLSAYAAQMLGSGKEAELGKMMAKLQFGNGLNENAVDRLYASRTVPGTNGDVIRPNAEALGYFVGAVGKGAQAVTKDINDQRDMTTAVLKSALTVIDKVFGKAGGGAVGISASVAKEWVQMGVRAAINDPTASAAKRLENAALPSNPTTGEPAVGQNVSDAFDGGANRVLRSATP